LIQSGIVNSATHSNALAARWRACSLQSSFLTSSRAAASSSTSPIIT